MIRTHSDARDAVDAGRTWLGFYRRNGPVMTASLWTDLSYAAGIPVANYYASAPLEAAVLPGRDGVDIGPAPAAGMRKYLKRVLMLPAVATGITQFKAHDICLFYPFIDGDGGTQEMVNTVPMPRYGGAGCRMMAVSQGAGTASSIVRVTYTNSKGVPGRQVDATMNLGAAAGSLVSSSLPGVASSFPCGPYLPLMPGDDGVLSVEAVDPLIAGGGIFALVIVKPLLDFGMFQASVAPVEVDCLADRSLILPELQQGAHVALIAQGTATAAPAFTAQLETIWG